MNKRGRGSGLRGWEEGREAWGGEVGRAGRREAGRDRGREGGGREGEREG